MIDFKRICVKSIRTMAQTMCGVIPSAGLFWSWDWRPILSATLVSGVVCFLMGVADTDNVTYPADEDAFYEDDENEEL